MGTGGFEIEYYDLPNGTYPAFEFITSQPPKMQAKLSWTVMLLEEHGNTLRMPYSEHLGDGIFQLRAIQGNDIARVFFFFVTGKKIILTHGFIKNTPKTPPSEIERAKKYRTEYLNRTNIQSN